MAVSDEFVEYVVEQLSRWGEVSIRRMFGGAGLYREGTMFAVVADDVAYLKVDDCGMRSPFHVPRQCERRFMPHNRRPKPEEPFLATPLICPTDGSIISGVRNGSSVIYSPADAL